MNFSNLFGPRFRLRFVAWRNRILGDPAFQRFALRFSPTAPIARKRAGALFDLVAGFTYSQTLFACVDCDLLEVLAQGPLELDAIADAIDVGPAGTVRLLRAAAALGLAEQVGERWTLGAQGAEMRGNSGIAEMIAHHRLLYADLADPVQLLRDGGGGGALQAYWHYARLPGEGGDVQVRPYSSLMAASQPMVAEQILDAYPFARHRRVLDVGGGSGAFVAALRARVPTLELGLFDLPTVSALAAARLAPPAGQREVAIFGGDFLVDSLPAGFDLISLVRIIHDHDDPAVLTLLRAVHAALPVGGRVLIAEPMAGTRGAKASGDAYFGLYLLSMGSGRPRRFDETAGLLATAGFRRIRELRTVLPLTARLVIGDK